MSLSLLVRIITRSGFVADSFIIWISISILASHIQSSHQMPAAVIRSDDPAKKLDISVGPCVWVIDRNCPDDDVKFYLFTRENPNDRQYVYIDTNLKTSNMSTSYFNAKNPTKIIIHGYNSDMFLQPLIEMKDEYLQRDKYNLFYVDWSNLAPGPCYISAVHNARHTGKCIAQLIERILDSQTNDIHLIGFSLGAQVTNFVAENLKSINFKLPRITGLDPAMPMFITASAENKLDQSDAEFVDVIHTNALVQGKVERCGHADFYMNGGVIQPGCWNAGSNPFACSHHRAPDYFSESIRSFRGFWGWACSTYINYLLGFCPKTNFLVIAGEDCRTSTRGMFLVTTNSVSPFAAGRWTDELTTTPITLKNPPLSKPISHYFADPLQQQLDPWGKLQSDFNNVATSPTPYSQDPNGSEWPYFNQLNSNSLQWIQDTSADKSLRTSTDSTVRSTTKKSPRPANYRQKNDKHNEVPFIEMYKKNLTRGIISPEVFQLPQIISN